MRPAHLTTVLVALATCAFAPVAAADPGFTVSRTGSSSMPCPVDSGCKGQFRRNGSTVAEVAVPLFDRFELVGHLATTLMQRKVLTESQAIAGLALRRRFDHRRWLEVGFGVAASDLAPSSIGPGDLWSGPPEPAMMVGAGTQIATWRGARVELVAHVGRAFDASIDQATIDLKIRGL